MNPITYCRTCLMPDTKPHLRFDADGVCSACLAHRRKNDALDRIDWQARAEAFEMLLQDAVAKKAPHYDVMIPVSGGKDSITQVHRVLDHGLRVLAINVDYGVKTDIGRRNLERIPEMGVDLLVFRPGLPLHKRLIRIGLEDFGDPDLLSHTLLHAAPLHLALRHEIPLALLGENAAFEYSGEDGEAGQSTMTRSWFDRYAANQGRDARHVSRQYGIPFDQLVLYDFPESLEHDDPPLRAEFMSWYFHWDSEEHLAIARRHGFETLPGPAEGTYRNYVGLDEKIHRIHQYLKVLKFGYGRATDHACEDIRNGRMTRDEARRLVRENDLQDVNPRTIDDVAEFLDMPSADLIAIMERYRNKDIWHRGPDGRWFIPHHLEDAVAAGAAS